MTSQYKLIAVATLALGCTGIAISQRAPGGPAQPSEFDSQYSLGPDSLPRDGVPKGELKGPLTLASKAWPGTQHQYWVYVPASYDGSRDMSLMVFQDGNVYVNPTGPYRAPNVLDNLIYRGDIPPMIAVFIDPGTFIADNRTNRTDEYMASDDRYSKVIIDEILPVVAKDYKISRDADRHGIAGWSAGAHASFTVAWQRSDYFHQLMTGIGAFADIQGNAGYTYPEKVLASEKKPIRIFMVDGRNDTRSDGKGKDGKAVEYDAKRDFFLQNVRLMEALQKKGYDINYSWGMGVHSHNQGGMMLPEMLRWLWRDQPISLDPKDTAERSFRKAAK
jgi:enterochelin esterase family protein